MADGLKGCLVLCHTAASVCSQAVCSFYGVIAGKCAVKVHEVMEPDWTVGLVIHQQPPVSPVPVRVSHEIIQYVHHMVGISIQLKDMIQSIYLMVLGIDLKGFPGYKAVSQGTHKTAAADPCPVIKSFFVADLSAGKAPGDPACKELPFHSLTVPVL